MVSLLDFIKDQEAHSCLETRLSHILRRIPEVLPILSVQEWRTYLALLNANYASSLSSDNFAERLFAFLKTSSPEKRKFGLEELVDAADQPTPHSVNGFSLPLVVLESVDRYFNSIGSGLRGLHGILYNIAHDRHKYNVEAPQHYHSFVKCIESLPTKRRSEVIKVARRISEYESSSLDKSAAIVALGTAVQRHSLELGDGLKAWMDDALKNHKVQDLANYFLDRQGYHILDVEKHARGLSLFDVRDRLCFYARAMTGRPVSVEPLDNSAHPFACKFTGETFLLPAGIGVFAEESKNYALYRALVAFQSGAYMFGTYTPSWQDLPSSVREAQPLAANPLDHFFSSFDNVALVQELYSMAEFMRIYNLIRNKFGGIRSDLELLVSQFLGHQRIFESASDVDKNLYVLWKCVYSGASSLPGDFAGVLMQQQHAEPSVASSLSFAGAMYAIFEKKFDVSQPIKHQPQIVDVADAPLIDQASGDSPVPVIVGPSVNRVRGKDHWYDEWDGKANKFKRDFVRVVEVPPDVVSGACQVLLDRFGPAVSMIRHHFEQLRPEEYRIVRKQSSGDVDLEAFIEAQADIRMGVTPSEQLYLRGVKNNRSVAALIVSEVSGSLRKFADLRNPKDRLIDYVKQTLLYFCQALEGVGDSYAVGVVSGETEKNVTYSTLKDFGDPFNEHVIDRIACIEPQKQNRDGAGLRHATAQLVNQQERTKLLIYLMEGDPHDFGYEGEYAVQDTISAIDQAKQLGIIPVVLCYGLKPTSAIRAIGEHVIYREVGPPSELAPMLPRFYEHLTLG